MIASVTNHLWQSTAFVFGVALLAWALRRNRASVRHALWVAASIKFLLPFSLLIALGAALAPERSLPPAATLDTSTMLVAAVDQLAQPFNHRVGGGPPPIEPIVPATDPRAWSAAAIAIWLTGFVAVVVVRIRGWRRIRALLRSSAASGIQLPGQPLDIRTSRGVLEPGVVGWRRPVLLVPEDIDRHLTATQLDAVLAHELCHVRRRDNLTATIHMGVEALFWFHPLVWWIGARLIAERERACDEHVLDTLAEPRQYAEGILAVCRRYVESPIACLSGVTGSDLKRRISNIVNRRIGLQLTTARRIVLFAAAVAALVLPFLVGVATAPLGAQQAGGNARFEVASIKPCPTLEARPAVPSQAGGRSGGAPWDAMTSPGYVFWNCVTLAQLVDQAYADADHPLLNTPAVRRSPSSLSPYPKRVRGGPSWVNSEMFTIEARAPLEVTAGALSGRPNRTLATLTGPMSQALRTLLEDRFQVKVRRVQEQQDMYALTVADSGLNPRTITKPTPGDCVTTTDYFAMDPGARPANAALCGLANISRDRGQVFTSFTMPKLAGFLATSSIERFVMDRTGLGDQPFNFVLKLEPDAGASADTLFARALSQLGLKLVPAKGPAEYLQIESAQRPKPDTVSRTDGLPERQTLPARRHVRRIGSTSRRSPQTTAAAGYSISTPNRAWQGTGNSLSHEFA
jgi:bla regulator protein BlaR1